MGWVDQFVEELLAPAAAANAVLTFLGAGLAFLGALWLFRRQLRHDRILAQDQRDAERDERVHEVRRLAARRLGDALIAAWEEFHVMNDEELLDAVKVPGFAGDQGAPGARIAYRAVQIADYELDLDDVIIDLWRARLTWWRAVRAVHTEERLSHLPEEQQAHVLFNLADAFFTKNGVQFMDLGRALLRWDGVGAVPTLDHVVRDGCRTRAEAAQTVNQLLGKQLMNLPKIFPPGR